MFLLKIFFVWLCVVFFVVPANALGVYPTGLMLSAETPVTNITLINEKDEPVTVQLELVRWEQKAEKDIYTPTTNIIATPPLFVIPPHESQLVRVGLEQPEFGSQERPYRLYAQEVIPRTKSKVNALRMSIRLGIPIIVKALVPVQQKILWHSTADKGKCRIVAENKGNNVIFINKLQGLSKDKKALTPSLNTFAYILPGSKRTWVMTSMASAKPTVIKATVNTETTLSDIR